VCGNRAIASEVGFDYGVDSVAEEACAPYREIDGAEGAVRWSASNANHCLHRRRFGRTAIESATARGLSISVSPVVRAIWVCVGIGMTSEEICRAMTADVVTATDATATSLTTSRSERTTWEAANDCEICAPVVAVESTNAWAAASSMSASCDGSTSVAAIGFWCDASVPSVAET
jgi:hypothetical protein